MEGNAHLEVEVKVLVHDLEAVRQRLAATAGARQVKPRVHEVNIRYDDASATLTPAGIVLRLRRDTPVEGEGGVPRARLTYKAPARQERAGVHARVEYEVTVGDFDEMDAILQLLGYHTALIYEKYRTTYELDGAEVVLDEMPFGAFVEVEGAADAIEAALAHLGLASAPRILESYVVLFERVKARLGLAFRDLTFENFTGVAVPPGAFDPQDGR